MAGFALARWLSALCVLAALGLNWQDHVVIDESLFRPAEVDALHCDPSRAATVLGWAPTISLEDMLAEMVEADLRRHRGTGTQPPAGA